MAALRWEQPVSDVHDSLPQNCIPSHGTYEADIGNDSEIITYHASGAAEPARARKQKIVCFGIEVATLCKPHTQKVCNEDTEEGSLIRKPVQCSKPGKVHGSCHLRTACQHES